MKDTIDDQTTYASRSQIKWVPDDFFHAQAVTNQTSNVWQFF